MLKRWLALTILLCSCNATEPSAVPKKRFRPSYNYVLMQSIRSDSDDGYYSTDENFKQAYLKTMTDTGDMSGDRAYDEYIKQKYVEQNGGMRPSVARKPISNAQEDEEVFISKQSDFVPSNSEVVYMPPSTI